LIWDDVDPLRIGTENADRQIIANAVRSQNPEGVGMCSGEKAVQFVGGQSGDFERFHGVSLKR
jgi:hypothetical protein